MPQNKEYAPFLEIGDSTLLKDDYLDFKEEGEHLENIISYGVLREELLDGVKVLEDVMVECTEKNVELLKVGNLIKCNDFIEMGTGEIRHTHHIYEIVEVPKVVGSHIEFDAVSITYRLTTATLKKPYHDIETVTADNFAQTVVDMSYTGYTNMQLNIEEPEIKQKGKLSVSFNTSLGQVILGSSSIAYKYFGLVAFRHNKGVTMVNNRGTRRSKPFLASTNLKALEETVDIRDCVLGIYCNADTLGGTREKLAGIVAKARKQGVENLELVGDTVYLMSEQAKNYSFPRLLCTHMPNPKWQDRTEDMEKTEIDKLNAIDFDWFMDFFCKYYTFEANKEDALPTYSVAMVPDNRSRVYSAQLKSENVLGLGDEVLIKSEKYGIERICRVNVIERDLASGDVIRVEFGDGKRGIGRWLEMENQGLDWKNNIGDGEDKKRFRGNYKIYPLFSFYEWANHISVGEGRYMKGHNTEIVDDAAEYETVCKYYEFQGFNPHGEYLPDPERDSYLWLYGSSIKGRFTEPGIVKPGEEDNLENKHVKKRRQALQKFEEEYKTLGEPTELFGGDEVRLAMYRQGDTATGLFLLGNGVAKVKVKGLGNATKYENIRDLFVSSCSTALDYMPKDAILNQGINTHMCDRETIRDAILGADKVEVNREDLNTWVDKPYLCKPILTYKGETGDIKLRLHKESYIMTDVVKKKIEHKSKMKWVNSAIPFARGCEWTCVFTYQGITDRGVPWLMLAINNNYSFTSQDPNISDEQMKEVTEYFHTELLGRYVAPDSLWNSFKGNI